MIQKVRFQHAYLVCVGLAVLTLAIYAQVGRFEFVNYDDGGYVFENPHVRTGLSPASAAWAFTTTKQSNWHPLTWISLMTDASIAGTNAGVYHLHNVLLHIASTILLFLLLARITGSTWRSAFVAALFAVHPLHVESVAWVAERKDVLSTLFWMLTMWAYVLYTARPRALTYAATLVLYALGLMAKPMLVTLPIALLVARGWVLRRAQDDGVGGKGRETRSTEKSRKHIAVVVPSPTPGPWPLIPMFLLAAASCAITYWAQASGGAVMRTSVEPIMARVQNAVVAYVAYIVAMVWPAKLAVFYPMLDPTITSTAAPLAALILAGISAWAYAKRRRFPLAWAGWLWYLITLVPVIGLVQVGMQARADRYTYIPLIGLFVAIAWTVPELVGPRLRRMLWVPAVGVVMALSVCAWQQVGCWQDSFTLARRAIGAVPGNYVGHLNLALAYKTRGDFANALDECTAALAVKPDYDGAHFTLGNLLMQRGDVGNAIGHLAEAVRLNPKRDAHRSELGSALLRVGRVDEAIGELREALRLNPELAAAHSNLAYALMVQRRMAEALEHASRAQSLAPESPDARVAAGLIELESGHLDRAIARFREALRLDPDHAEARTNIGVAYFRQRRYAEAAEEFSEALRLAPNDPDIARNLAAAKALAARKRLGSAAP